MRGIGWIAALFLIAGGPEAFAWGAKAHAAIAELASASLTPAAHAQVADLLAADLDRAGRPSGRTTLAEVAAWADEIREAAEPEAYRGWHSRANPVCAETLAKCRNGHCADQLILQYAAVLRDRQQDLRARNEALKWIVHLVGDLHQPLHVGVGPDRGMRRVVLGDEAGRRPRTLHQVWDRELAVLALARGPLQRMAPLPAYTPAAVEAWMREAREVSRTVVYASLPGAGCVAAAAEGPWGLDAAYQARAVEAIRLQLERAGARLAALLNASLQ